MTAIHHDREQHRFTLLAGTDNAVLDYHLFDGADGQPGVNFTHTWVPPVARGQGFAERLVREGLRWAKSENLTIQASCWYVAKFLRL